MKNLVLYFFIILLLTGCSQPASMPAGNQFPGPQEEAAVDLQPSRLDIVAVGDIMLSRVVGSRIRNNSVYYPFEKTRDITSKADVTFGNLETTLATTGTKLPGKGIWFRAVPEASEGLKDAGFDVLSLANNHILDYDTPALMETIEVLEGAGIGHVGAGEDLGESRRPIIVVKNGIRVGFLAYNEFYNYYWSYSYKRTFEATEEIAGTAPLKEEIIEEDVKKLRSLCDILVVSLHWGVEESNRVTDSQRELAHQIIDWGADIILGHHPHVLQGVELYNGKLIAYSLGNFIFDQNDENNKQSMILHIFLEENEIKEVHAYPVYIVDKCQPQIPDGSLKEYIINKIARLSKSLGTEGTKEENKVVFKYR